jgi:hypothetical protein
MTAEINEMETKEHYKALIKQRIGSLERLLRTTNS